MFSCRNLNNMKIDVFEICRIYFSLNKKSKMIWKHHINKGYIFGFFNFFRLWLYYLLNSSFLFGNCVHNKDLFLYISLNQKNALLPVCKFDDNSLLMDVNTLPLHKSFCYSLPYLLTFIKVLLSTDKERRKIVKRDSSIFFLSYGLYVLSLSVIRHYKPRLIVLATDHSPITRALLLACNKMNVPSFYIQHASVTERFPPLICRYAILDGEDAYNKYKTTENCRKVFILGGSRFDRVKKNNNQKALGIALTLSDNITKLEELCKLLISYGVMNYFMDVIIRPHPRMNISSISKICNKYSFQLSDPTIEDSLSFLNETKFLIANESSIHLDAGIMQVPSILYSNLSSLPFRDHYGYVRNGLVERVDFFEQLWNVLVFKKIYVNIDTIKKYNASTGTIYDGNVSYIVNQVILSEVCGIPLEITNIKRYGKIYKIQ